MRLMTHRFHRIQFGVGDLGAAVIDDIAYQPVKNALETFIEPELLRSVRVEAVDFFCEFGKQRNALAHLLTLKHQRFHAVIQVGGAVSDLIRKVNELCFKRRTEVKQVLGKLREFRRIIIARVLDDAFTYFKGEIESGKISVTLLKLLHDPKSVQVVIKAVTVLAHQMVEHALSGMAKRWMANIVDQGQRFHQLFIETKFGGNCAGNLRDFNGVREAIAEMIRILSGKYLRLVFQTAKGARVHHTVPVTLEGAAVWVRRFRISPATAVFCAHCVRSEHWCLV